jgi:prephenate dehydrogenase
MAGLYSIKRLPNKLGPNSSPVNAAAKQHNRVVYSSQAIHHVAYQIASLYWSSVSEETRSRAAFTSGVEKTADMSRHM